MAVLDDVMDSFHAFSFLVDTGTDLARESFRSRLVRFTCRTLPVRDSLSPGLRAVVGHLVFGPPVGPPLFPVVPASPPSCSVSLCVGWWSLAGSDKLNKDRR